MDNEKIANRIRALRLEAGISQEELGARMASDITGSTVAKLEKGRLKLSLEYAQEIADVFGVSLLEVLGFDDAGVRLVPLVGSIAAGSWQEAIEMSDESQVIPGNIRGKDLFALRPVGDSMDLLVQEGGYIVVDPHDTDMVDGRYYVVMNEAGEATFKRFFVDPIRLEPCSTNPDHKTIVPGVDMFRIIGRVIYQGQPL